MHSTPLTQLASRSRTRTRTIGSTLRLGTAGLLVGAASLAAALSFGMGSAGAATIDGIATISAPGAANGTSLGASGLPSSTLYKITPPTGAVCSGNTATNGILVYTYLVPSGTNVQNLTITNGFPSTGLALFDYQGNAIEGTDVASNDVVPSLPINLEWGPAVSGDSLLSQLLYTNPGTANASGVWEGGIACANSSGQITDYWNTEITFKASSSDPGGFTWGTQPGDPNNAAAPEVPYAIVLPLLAIVAGGSVVLIRRRRASAAPAVPVA